MSGWVFDKAAAKWKALAADLWVTTAGKLRKLMLGWRWNQAVYDAATGTEEEKVAKAWQQVFAAELEITAGWTDNLNVATAGQITRTYRMSAGWTDNLSVATSGQITRTYNMAAGWTDNLSVATVGGIALTYNMAAGWTDNLNVATAGSIDFTYRMSAGWTDNLSVTTSGSISVSGGGSTT